MRSAKSAQPQLPTRPHLAKDFHGRTQASYILYCNQRRTAFHDFPNSLSERRIQLRGTDQGDISVCVWLGVREESTHSTTKRGTVHWQQSVDFTEGDATVILIRTSKRLHSNQATLDNTLDKRHSNAKSFVTPVHRYTDPLLIEFTRHE